MLKSILTNILIVALFASASAQNYTYTSVNHDGIELTKYDKDPTASAVVLQDKGEVRFMAGGYGRVFITFEKFARIKIFNKEGFKYGKVEIPLYNTDQLGMEESVDQIRAITIYKDNNGVVKSEQLNDFDIKYVKRNKYNKTVTFLLPNLKPGCVIEFAYRFMTPFLQNLHPWMFQDEIPKITSKFETYIPLFWNYSAMLRGNKKLDKNTSSRVNQCYVVGTLKSDCVYTLYEMNDIPAFVKEDYMAIPKNFHASLHFELNKFLDPAASKNAKVASGWEEIDKQFFADDFFGGQFKRIDNLTPKFSAAVAGLTDKESKARAIFQFIQKNIKWDSVYATSSSNIRKALDKHTGDSGDINLLLAAALKNAGISAAPLLISTPEHGTIYKQYPSPTAFDYVIVEATIDDRVYLLDATDPQLPFGVLPNRSLGDEGRVLSTDTPPHWTSLITNQNKNTTYLLNLALQTDGKLKGTLNTRFSNYAAYEKKVHIRSFKTTNEYVDNLAKKLQGITILKSAIENLDSLNSPLTESFEIEIESAKPVGETLTITPYLINHTIVNPFAAEERKYPVDLGVTSDVKTIINISFPENYEMSAAPSTLALSLPDQGGRFSVTSQAGPNTLSLTHLLSLKKPVYNVTEYQQLRELYDKIIEHEKSVITFKKKM